MKRGKNTDAPVSEKTLERWVVKAVEKRGGRALKWVSWIFTGMPDRVCLLPGARCLFAELKTTGEQLSHRQKLVIRWLESLGFEVHVIDGQATFDQFEKALDHGL